MVGGGGDIRIPTRRLNQRIPRLNPPFLLRLLNHPQRNPVLDRPAGIEEFEFGVDLGFDSKGLWDTVESDHGGSPDVGAASAESVCGYTYSGKEREYNIHILQHSPMRFFQRSDSHRVFGVKMSIGGLSVVGLRGGCKLGGAIVDRAPYLSEKNKKLY